MRAGCKAVLSTKRAEMWFLLFGFEAILRQAALLKEAYKDVIWMSENGHPYSLEDPVAYGQYNLVPEVSSENKDIGSGKYGWQTSTGGSHEILVADATPGMKQMMLHSKLQ